MFTQVSDKFKELMSSNRGQMSTELEIRIDPGASTPTRIMIYQDDIVSIDYHGASCEDHIAVGTFVLPTLTVRIKASCQEMQDIFNYNINLKGAEIRWNVLLQDETMQEPESAQVCILTIKRISPTADGENMNITAESKYVGKIDTVYTPTITFPSNASAVLDDIAAQLVEYYGNVLVGIDRTRVSNFHIESIPARATFRDVLRSIAEYNGLFVTIDRDDIMIMFIWYGTVLHDPDYEIFKVSKDCCSDVQLTKVDEGYNGLVCPTATQVVTEGDAPFLALENRCKMFDYYPQRVSEIQERICEIKCRTGRVSMALGNILFDPWDMLKIEPDIRHNLLTCGLASTTVSGVSITRNNDGTYFLNGVATDLISVSMQSNDLPAGNYTMRSDIVDPSGNADDITWSIHGTYDESQSEVIMDIVYDSTFVLPRGVTPWLPCDHHTLYLTIHEGASFDNVLIRPMITAAEDDYDQYEVYQADQLFPVSQIDHQYDGGLRTVITIPEITQNDDGTVEYTGGDSEVEADIAAMQAQIASKADASTVTALAATVATKADAATVGAQIAQLTNGKADKSAVTAGFDRIIDTLGTEGSINLFPIDKGVPGNPVIVEDVGGDFAVQQGNDNNSPFIAFEGTSDNSNREEYRTYYNNGYRFEDDNPWLFGDIVPGDYVLSFDILDDVGFADVADFVFEIYESAAPPSLPYGDLIATCTGSNTEFTVTAAKPFITILAVAKLHDGESWVGDSIAVTPFLRRKAFETETCDIYKPSVAKQLAQIRYQIANLGGGGYNETQTDSVTDEVREVT